MICGTNHRVCHLTDYDLVEIGTSCELSSCEFTPFEITYDGRTATKTCLEKIKLGNDVEVGLEAWIGGGTTLGDGCAVGRMSCVPPGTVVPSGVSVVGNPALFVSRA